MVSTKTWVRKSSKTGVYKITSPSGKVYIGQSWDIINRWRSHKFCKRKSCPLLHNSFLKYGVDKHLFEIIHTIPKDVSQNILNEYEILYIKLYRDAGFLMLNISEGGCNSKHSEETKKKISESNMGVKRPSLVGKIPWNKGLKTGVPSWNSGLTGCYIMSEETKSKIKRANIGKKYSLGSKRPLSAILATAEKNRGKKRTKEQIQNIINNKSIPQNIGKWNIGKKRTQETKDKIKKTLKSKTDNKGESHNMAKLSSLDVLDIRRRYVPRKNTARMLAKEYGMSKTNILDIINYKLWAHI